MREIMNSIFLSPRSQRVAKKARRPRRVSQRLEMGMGKNEFFYHEEPLTGLWEGKPKVTKG